MFDTFTNWLWSFANESLLITWAVTIAVLSVVEAFFAAERGQPLKLRAVNLSYGVVYAAVIFTLGPAVFFVVNAVTAKLGGGWIDLTPYFASASIPSQFALALVWFLITDFFYYWLHRMQHVVPWLWDQHAVHHSDIALNATTSIRHHWLEFMFQAFAISIPMAVLFKLPPISIWAIATLFAAWSFFIHTNLRLQFGRASWLLCGPQVHRIHHSSLPEHTDKNFAAYFPIWDVVFGTWHAPKAGEFPPTGLHSGERMDNPALLAVWPFKAWIGRVLGRRS